MPQTKKGDYPRKSVGIVMQRNDPSDLPPCPAAASKLCSLAVEPILDILSDRL